jgi:hypothetical protein
VPHRRLWSRPDSADIGVTKAVAHRTRSCGSSC